jgi:hypothetical protein
LTFLEVIFTVTAVTVRSSHNDLQIADIDSRKTDDDKLKLELNIQEEGLLDEQILKYLSKLHPSNYVLVIYF